MATPPGTLWPNVQTRLTGVVSDPDLSSAISELQTRDTFLRTLQTWNPLQLLGEAILIVDDNPTASYLWVYTRFMGVKDSRDFFGDRPINVNWQLFLDVFTAYSGWTGSDKADVVAFFSGKL